MTKFTAKTDDDIWAIRATVRESIYQRLKRMQDDPDAVVLAKLMNPVDGPLQMAFPENVSTCPPGRICIFDPEYDGRYGRPTFLFSLDQLTIPKGDESYMDKWAFYPSLILYPVFKDEFVDPWVKDLLGCFKEGRTTKNAAIVKALASIGETADLGPELLGFPDRNEETVTPRRRLARAYTAS
jgi:hypothetical protein